MHENPMRLRLERGLSALALAALAAALWTLLEPARPPEAAGLSSGDLAAATPLWSLAPPSRAHLRLEATPDAIRRDWLAALGKTGMAVSWEAAPDASLRASGVAVEPLADPRLPLRIWAAAEGGGPLDLVESGDEARVLAVLPSGAGVVALPSLNGGARLRGESAGALPRDALELKPVLLLGRASWEARFALAALEEQGWKVDARLTISPGQILGETPRAARPDGKPLAARSGRGGGPGGPDAAGGGPPPAEAPPPAQPLELERYAAVVVLDESAAPHASAIKAFVETGGGLLTLGRGAFLPALREISPAAAPGPVQEALSFSDEAEATGGPRGRLELRPLEDLREDAHVVERRGEAVAVAIRRQDEGRVLQAGYEGLWRWRMAAPEADAPEASRAWLAGLLSAVARAPRSDAPSEPLDQPAQDPAPLAAWHAAFGEAETAPADAGAAWSADKRLAAFFGLAALALLSQWASRRSRGAP